MNYGCCFCLFGWANTNPGEFAQLVRFVWAGVKTVNLVWAKQPDQVLDLMWFVCGVKANVRTTGFLDSRYVILVWIQKLNY